MVFSKAFHDTFDGRAARTVFFVLIGAALSLLVVWVWLGPGEAMTEVPFIVAGAIGAAGPLVMLFLWNLSLAPFQLMKERALKAERDLNHLRSQESDTPRLVIDVETISWGGTYESYHDEYLCFAYITVKNVGKMPSVAQNWQFSFDYDGKPIKGNLSHLDSFTMVTPPGHPDQVFTSETGIYMKRDTIIPVGGSLSGHLIAFVQADSAPQSGVGVDAIISCNDVLGRVSRKVYSLGQSLPPRYIPGSILKFEEDSRQ